MTYQKTVPSWECVKASLKRTHILILFHFIFHIFLFLGLLVWDRFLIETASCSAWKCYKWILVFNTKYLVLTKIGFDTAENDPPNLAPFGKTIVRSEKYIFQICPCCPQRALPEAVTLESPSSGRRFRTRTSNSVTTRSARKALRLSAYSVLLLVLFLRIRRI